MVTVVVLTSCATSPKIALRPEAKQSIKRIALVETQEPAQYLMNPGQLPGGQALYVFGAIGGAILGGIEASRTEAATARFTAAVAPLNPDLSGILTAQLETALRAKGYDVVRVASPPIAPDGKGVDLAKIEGRFDAILSATLLAGYSADSVSLRPRITVSILLLSNPGTQKLFAETYIYASRTFGKWIHISPDPKHSIGSIEAVYNDLDIAVDGLRTGTTKIVERAVTDL